MASEALRLTDREQARGAELARACAGPLGVPLVSHVLHLALGLGLDAMGASLTRGGALAGGEATVPPPGETHPDLDVAREVVGELLGRVERAAALVAERTPTRAPRGLDADQSGEAVERRRVRTNERNRAARKRKREGT